jgi:hypothetical protein
MRRVEHAPAGVERGEINDPGLLLADEPTGNLDSVTGGEIVELLLDLRRARGMSVIVAPTTRSWPRAAIASFGYATAESWRRWMSPQARPPPTCWRGSVGSTPADRTRSLILSRTDPDPDLGSSKPPH